MIQSPGILLTILAFALVIGPLVFVHELGHYCVGRWFGVHAEAFSIGFGREIAGITDRRGTRWKFGWLPLGGYVKFAGDMSPAGGQSMEWLALPAAERARTFQAKPVWQRALIVAAGPVTNFLVALAILSGLAAIYGENATPNIAGRVVKGSAAQTIGIMPGDRVLSIGGQRMSSFGDMLAYVQPRAGERVDIVFSHRGRTIARSAVIGSQKLTDKFGNSEEAGLLGVAPPPLVTAPVPLWQAPAVAAKQMWMIVDLTGRTIGQVITGRRSLDILHGPVGTARISGEQLTLGVAAFVWLIAIVSINLGFINLLPVPVLDGGHLLFYAIEAVRRRPVGAAAQEWAFRGGLAAILALMLFVTFNDLASVGLWKNLAGLIG